MNTPWIARLLLVLLGLEAGICTAFLADHWSPLRQREEAAFQRLLDSDENLGLILDSSSPAERTRTLRPLQAGTPSTYLNVEITKDEDRFFESFPPSPIDWSLILKNVRTESPGIAAIDHPLTWENAGDLALETLDHEISLFKRVVLCVDLRRAPVGQTLPAYLQRSAIPLTNLTNETVTLPSVNRLVLPPSATGADNTLFAFRTLEGEKTNGQMPPAFARWGDHLIPSFPIALAMAQHDVNPKDVEITLGSHARLGNGPVIALDEFGRILLPHDENNKIALPPSEQRSNTFATANDIADGDFSFSPLQNDPPKTILFTDNTGLGTAPWHDARTLANIANAVDILPTPGQPTTHHRFPLWIEILILTLLASLGAACLTLKPLSRNLLFPLLVLCGLVLVGALLRINGSWTPFTPVLACTLATWILATLFIKDPTPEEYPQA